MGLVKDYLRDEFETWGRFRSYGGEIHFQGWRTDANKASFCSPAAAGSGSRLTALGHMVIDHPLMGVLQFSDGTTLTYIHHSVLKDFMEGEETTS